MILPNYYRCEFTFPAKDKESAKRRHDSLLSSHQFHTAESLYCVLFCKSLMKPLEPLKLVSMHLEAERVTVQSFFPGQVSFEEQLRLPRDHFKDDIHVDFRRLLVQLQ